MQHATHHEETTRQVRTGAALKAYVERFMFREADAYRRIVEATENPDPDVEFVPTRSGDLALKMAGKNVESMYDPVSGAQVIIESQDLTNAEFVVLVGAGGGSLPKVLQDYTTQLGSDIGVYEPNITVLAKLLQEADLSGIDAERVQFFTSPQALKLFIASRFRRKGGLMVVLPPAYRKLYPTIVADLEPDLVEATGLANINANTCNSRAREWVHNVVRNLERASECPNVNVLSDAFKGIPGVVVSAGPSLDKNVHLLRAVQDDVVIFAVNTSLRALLAAGVQPHFVVSLESLNLARQFEGIHDELAQTNLVLALTAHPSHYDLPAKRTFQFVERDASFVGYMAEATGQDVEGLMTGASIANATFSLANRLGCDPLILIGQDLAYTDGKVYAKQTVFGELSIDTSKTSSEIIDPKGVKQSMLSASYSGNGEKKFFGNRSLIATKAWGGEGEVMTSMDFALFRVWFQEVGAQLRGAENIRTMNCTEGGAHIEGFDHIPLADALAEVVNKLEPGDIQARVQAAYEAAPRVDSSRVRETLIENIDDYESLAERTHDAMEALADLKMIVEEGGLGTQMFSLALEAFEEAEAKVNHGNGFLVEAIINGEVQTILNDRTVQQEEDLAAKWLASLNLSERLFEVIHAAAIEVGEDIKAHVHAPA